MMKCVFISCFDSYDIRIKPIEVFLSQRGYECDYITSDFNHVEKSNYTVNRNKTIQIKVLPYYKNLSVRRLLSHYIFAKKAIREVKRIKPDLLYVMLPPNSLAWFASRYKKKNKVRLVYDLYDLWPETFPSRKAKNLLALPFKFWGGLRDKNLSAADFVITECNLYQSILKDVLKGIKTKTIYLAKSEARIDNEFLLDKDKIHLCYLGSINNIIDIPKIKKLVKAINELKPTVLHIIGDGGKKDTLIKEIKNTGAIVEYYGKVYDPKEKQQIFDKCHFGLNIMKDTVCVGLTLKSIDYFQAGLPILNSIRADTTLIVEQYKIGINVTDENIANVATKVVNANVGELLEMRENTKKVFNSLFSLEAFNEKLEDVFKKI